MFASDILTAGHVCPNARVSTRCRARKPSKRFVDLSDRRKCSLVCRYPLVLGDEVSEASHSNGVETQKGGEPLITVASKPKKIRRKDDFYVTFITLSQELQDKLPDGVEGDDGLSASYAIFTKHPLSAVESLSIGPKDRTFWTTLEPYQDLQGRRKTFRIQSDKLQLVRDYKRCYLHSISSGRDNFDGSYGGLMEDALLLPVFVDKQTSKWGVAWGIMTAACSMEAGRALNELMEGILSHDMDESRRQKIMDEFMENLQLPVSQVHLKDAMSFLSLFPIVDRARLYVAEKPAQWKRRDQMEVHGHVLPEGALKLPEVLRYIGNPGNKVLNSAAIGFRVYPVPSKWFEMGFLVGGLLHSISACVSCMQLHEAYPSLSEIPISELAKGFPLLGTDNDRLEYQGMNLLNYLMTSDHFIRQNGRSVTSDPYEISLRCRRESLGEVLPHKVLAAFLKLNPETELEESGPQVLHSPSEYGEGDEEIEIETEWVMPPEQLNRLAGQVCLGLVGVCYNHSGIQLARKVCTEMGFLDSETFLTELEEHSIAPWRVRYEWEVPKPQSPLGKARVKKVLRTVSNIFQYDFNVWQRLANACIDSSFEKVRQTSSLTRGMEILGTSAFKLLITNYNLMAMPSATQTDLNRAANEGIQHEAMGRIVAKYGLDKEMKYDYNAYKERMEEGRQQFLSFNPGMLTRHKPPKPWIRLFRALVGAVLVDSGFDLEVVERAVIPLVEPYLQRGLSLYEADQLVSPYKRYIPTHIVPAVYDRTVSENVTQMYATIVRFQGPLAGVRKGMERGFFILTGAKLPSCPPFEINYPPDWDNSACKVILQNHSEDVLRFNRREISIVEEFQFKFYENIAVWKGIIVKKTGEYEKRYNILPALGRVGSEGGDWQIDWDLVHNVVNDEVPAAWEEILHLVSENPPPDEEFARLKSQITADPTFEELPSDMVPVDEGGNQQHEQPSEIMSLVQSIVWRKGEDQLIWISDYGRKFSQTNGSSSGKTMWGNLLLNGFGLVNCLPRAGRKRNTISVRWSKDKRFKPTPISILCLYRAWVLPSVLHRLEGYLLADDFRSMYSLSPKVPLHVLATALTCRSALDLESSTLYPLGDTVLEYIVGVHMFMKYKNWQAGKLSIQVAVIQEGNPIPLKHRQLVAGHLSASPFHPHKIKTAWCPPGVPPMQLLAESEASAKEQVGDELHPTMMIDDRVVARAQHMVPDKLLSVHMKSVVGALFLHAGLPSVENFLMKLRVVDGVLKLGKVQKKRTNAPRLLELESALGYKFNNMEILAESLVHSSLNPIQNYERLEYLGDKVIEVLCTKYVVDHYGDASKGIGFELRTAIAANETLARVAMSPPLRLHRAMVHSITGFSEEIRMVEEELMKKQGNAPGELGDTLPKICGDIFESVIGGILVDSGFNLSVVWKVLYPLLEDFLTKGVQDPEWLWERIEGDENSSKEQG